MTLWDGGFWAQDTFRHGGDLVDAGSWYAMADKLQHLIGCAALWLLLALLPLGIPVRLAWWTAGAVGVEVLEGVRLAIWWEASAIARRHGWTWSWKSWAWANNQTTIVAPIPASPPVFADRPSWRDLVADVAGLVVAGAYLWVLRGSP